MEKWDKIMELPSRFYLILQKELYTINEVKDNFSKE